MPDAAGAVAETAPAKINLALHVTGRRSDGYHLIESLAVFTAFGDRVTVASANQDVVRVTGRFGAGLPIDDSNLVVRAREAVRLLLEDVKPRASRSTLPPSVLPDISPTRGEIGSSNVAARPALPELGDAKAAGVISPLVGELSGRTEGDATKHRSSTISIHLEKNLPIASGIGGGSSDAAATLTALNRYWNGGLSDPQLAAIGLPLGADVPMCLMSRPLIARGIGEAIAPVPDFPALSVVLVNPGVGISTPRIFAALKSRENPPLPPLPPALDFAALIEWLSQARNDLMAPALLLEPAIGEALEALTAQGAPFVRMSGSGATCFGLFRDMDTAHRAARGILRARPDWFVVATETMKA